MKKALISGITGQDGSYLADYFCKKVTKFTVSFVVLRRFNTGRIEHLYFDEWVQRHETETYESICIMGI